MATNIKDTTIAAMYDRLVLVQDGNDIGAGTDTMNIEIQTQAGVATATPLYISTNRIGIGTATPTGELEVASATNADIILTRGDSSISATDSIGQLSWKMVDADFTTDSDITSGIKVLATQTHDGANFGSQMIFMTSDNTSSSLSNVMILDEDGNVGIGTTTPDYMLDIENAGTASMRVYATASNGDAGLFLQSHGTGDALIQFRDDSDTEWTIGNDASDSDKFKMGSSTDGTLTTDTRLTIDLSGKVGIGTTSPDHNLEVASPVGATIVVSRSDDSISDGDSLGFFGFQAQDADGSTDPDLGAKISAIAGQTHDGANFGTDLAFYTADNTSSTLTERIRILDSGNVGIGTSAPDVKLHIQYSNATAVGSISEDSNNNAFQIENTNGTGGSAASIHLLAKDANAYISHEYTSSNVGKLHFTMDNKVSALVIDNDGKVGIGTSSPGALLTIPCDSDSVRAIEVSDADAGCDANNIMISMDYSGDADCDGAVFIYFQDSDGNIGEISCDGAATTYATSSDYRLKEDFKDIVDATGTINQLKLYDFAWKRNNSKRSMGVIAHEAQAIVPTAITGVKDAMTTKEYIDADGVKKTKDVVHAQGADYSKFVPLLLKSIQELSAKVTALENA